MCQYYRQKAKDVEASMRAKHHCKNWIYNCRKRPEFKKEASERNAWEWELQEVKCTTQSSNVSKVSWKVVLLISLQRTATLIDIDDFHLKFAHFDKDIDFWKNPEKNPKHVRWEECCVPNTGYQDTGYRIPNYRYTGDTDTTVDNTAASSTKEGGRVALKPSSS